MQPIQDNTMLGSPGRWVSVIHRYKTVFLDRELADIGLNGSSYLYIVVLDTHGTVRQDTFCREIALNKGCVARSMSRLEELDYIKREADPDDKRVMLVSLTRKGKRQVKHVRNALHKFQNILAHGLTDNQVMLANNLLLNMKENVSNHFAVIKEGES